MKIAFLDIDGVVLPVGALQQADVEAILRDPDTHLDFIVEHVPADIVARLRQLGDNGVKFVVISTWRRLFKPEFIRLVFDRLGLAPYLHEDWLAIMHPTSSKGHDIGLWLGDHPGIRQEDCVVIDDDHTLHLREDYGFSDLTHVRPTSNVGFSTFDLEEALGALDTGSKSRHG